MTLIAKWLYNGNQMVTLDRIQNVAKALGGRPALGTTVTSSIEMDRVIRSGMPARVFSFVRKSVRLSERALGDMLGISQTTLQRRKHQRRMNQEESERLYGLGRVLALGQTAFGSLAPVPKWLTEENTALGGRAPADLLQTEAGVRTVEALLGRLIYGGYD